MITVEANAFVSFKYELYDEEGEHIDGTSLSGDTLDYVHGYGQVVFGLERQVGGLAVGEHKTVWVSAEEGFGDHDEEGVFEVDREELPGIGPDSVGEVYELEGPDGEMSELLVVEVRADSVLVDANHPLAGRKLRYEIEVAAIREATDKEREDAAFSLQSALDEVHGTGVQGGVVTDLTKRS